MAVIGFNRGPFNRSMSGVYLKIAAVHEHTPAQEISVTTPDLDNYYWVTMSAAAAVTDVVRSIDFGIAGLVTPDTFTAFKATLPDHNSVDRTVFYGIVTTTKPTIIPGKNSAKCIGYDHGYYLARQYPPNGSIFSADTYDPKDIVSMMIGNDTTASEWRTQTGIYPYRLRDTSTSQTDDYVWQSSATRQQIISDLCNQFNSIFLIKPGTVSGEELPCAYFVPLADIDDAAVGLDLPDPVTFTNPDNYIVGDIKVEMKDETKYNKVTVYSFADDGSVYTDTASDPGVDDGSVLPIEYVEETTQYDETSIVGTADTLLGDLNREVSTYTAILLQRTDLELLQKVKFSGFTGVPSDWMRIISIKYSGKVADTRVEIQCMLDFDVMRSGIISRAMSATGVSNMQTIAQDAVNSSPKAMVGTVSSVGTNTCTITNERGESITVRYVE